MLLSIDISWIWQGRKESREKFKLANLCIFFFHFSDFSLELFACTLIGAVFTSNRYVKTLYIARGSSYRLEHNSHNDVTFYLFSMQKCKKHKLLVRGTFFIIFKHAPSFTKLCAQFFHSFMKCFCYKWTQASPPRSFIFVIVNSFQLWRLSTFNIFEGSFFVIFTSKYVGTSEGEKAIKYLESEKEEMEKTHSHSSSVYIN